MTDETESLILEHLRVIRRELGEARQDLRDIKLRVGDVETSVAHLHSISARHSVQFDRVHDRLDRIETRLGLVDA